MEAMEISRTGLDVEWQRLQIVTQNIANMNSSRSVDGGPYVARQLVSGPARAFQDTLQGTNGSHGQTSRGVMIYGIEAQPGGIKRIYSPSHPDADAEGFVSMPDISSATEMTNLIRASRAYEANLVAFSAAQQMYSSAMRMGRSS